MDLPGGVGEPFDVIVLAGGGARRLGGADKPALEVGGVSLLDRVLAACRDAASVAVVGPPRQVSRAVVFTREYPPGGGPVPALAAGLTVGSAGLVAVFAADLPFLDAEAVTVLRRSLTADAVLYTDARGKDQLLAALYRRNKLAAALEALPGLRGARLFSVLNTLEVTRIPDTRGATTDCDTWDAVHAARALVATRLATKAKMEDMDDKKQLADWCAAAAAELGLTGHELTDADLDAILGLAGVAAHNVLRPAAPLTTFLAGYAIGLRSSTDGGRGALDGPIAKLSALAQAWDPATGTAAGPGRGGPVAGTVGGSVAGTPAATRDASAGGAVGGATGATASAAADSPAGDSTGSGGR
ncbi:NTP transferase domain-containing protein [Catenulispora sp. NF23]|uniref:NTP transferase domain-containing protein n=1 Tax=Catenulispora pinistramenti TaxID=2705254 RepID=UPI001BAAEE00|nr:NTP transferase domain-containing protein [Catenulispora pinistramenti]MBS2531313.1 NTP transferase domain-containing protein [Catenulispora pinistramenti]